MHEALIKKMISTYTEAIDTTIMDALTDEQYTEMVNNSVDRLTAYIAIQEKETVRAMRRLEELYSQKEKVCKK